MESHYNHFDLIERINRAVQNAKATFLPPLLAIICIALPVKKANAQSAPTLSYSSPQTYAPSTAITPLAPTSTGVASPAYSTTPVTINTGLSSPFGVATDAAGNLYVSDLSTMIVKEFPAGGGSPVIIGSGQFSHPEGITVDAAGNVYAAGDYNGHVTEILKSNGSAVNSGTGFNEFSDVAVDAAGNIYVADFGDAGSLKEILKSNGNTVTVGTGFSNYVISVATDAAGNVYAADTHIGIFEVLASNGNTVSLGSGFSNPQGVAVDAEGNVFVSDQGNGAIKEIPVGSSTPITLVSGLTDPGQIAVDGAGNIYFVDTQNETVQEISPVGGYYINAVPPGLSFSNSTGVLSGTTTSANLAPTNYTVTAYNASGSANVVINISVGSAAVPTLSYQSPQTYTMGQAITPLTPTSSGVSAPGYSGNKIVVGNGYNVDEAVATDAAGNVYVTDSYHNAVLKIPAGGGVQDTIASKLTGGLYGVAVDAAGNVYVSETGSNAVLKIPAGGGTPVSIGSGISGPNGLAVDAAGNVYVAEHSANDIKKIAAADGSTSVIATGLGNGYGVAVDAAGNVYVAATFNNKIVKIPAGGGSQVSIGGGFSTPVSVAVDAVGNVYVSDFDSKSVKMVSADGSTTTTIATGFGYPQGVAVDGAGNVYVADGGPDVVDQLKPSGGYYINSAVPAGLTFNGASGVISGTPSVLSTAQNYTVTAYNAAGSTAATVNLGVVAPVSITSITRQGAATSTGFYLSYTVVFSGPVTGLKPSNFSVTTSGGITGADVNYVNGSGNTYTVGIFTGSGDGTETLNMVNDLGVVPGISTPMPFAGNSYTIDKSQNSGLSGLLMNPYSALKLVSSTPSQANFTASVTYATNSVTLEPIVNDTTATITVAGQTVKSGTYSQAITLNTDGTPTAVTTVVTAQNGAQRSYIVTISKVASGNNGLAGLQMSPNNQLMLVSSGPSQASFNASVSPSTTSVMFEPTLSDATATITVAGQAVMSGTYSQAVMLNTDGTPTTVTTIVTAQNGTQRSYIVTVSKVYSANNGLAALQMNPNNPLTLVSSSQTQANFTASVSASTSSVMLKPTADDTTATITVAGEPVQNGTYSQAITLNTNGTPTQVTTVVTAQNGAQRSYVISITRAGGGSNAAVMPQEPFRLDLITDVVVHQAVTPDGDGINDYLKIDGIDQYPDNKLAIINPSGVQVYQAKGYDNKEKKFDGHSNLSGKMLEPGTYYYMLDYTMNGKSAHTSGYFVLKY